MAQVAPQGGAPALAIRVPVAPVAVVTDGRPRLSYELHLENRGSVALSLSSVEIRTDEGGTRISLDGDPLIRLLGRPAGRSAPMAIPAGGRRVAYVDFSEDRPSRSVHHVIRTASPEGEYRLDVQVDQRPPVVLDPPLAGGPWAAVYHPDWERGHRRVFYTVDGVTRLPGRYTIDFVKLDEAGRTAEGHADVVANALGYGADVLAVQDATVAAARDGMPEVSHVSKRVTHAQEDAAGNYVSLDLGDGRYAVYEHLKPGSVRARPGQRVRRGEVIAQLGFTGDSTGPHLHLHVGDAAAPVAAEGLPYVFSRFEVLGRYLDIARMGTERWQAVGTGVRHRERPGPNVVIEFGPVGTLPSR